MKRYLKALFIFAFPIIVYIIIALSFDVFKIYKDYDSYYDGTNAVTLNRTYVSTKTYLKYKDSLHYNAFIFGSSRSQAYKTPKWKHYLPNDAVPFHYDAHSEDLYGIYTKLHFLDENHGNIKYALIIIDRQVLAGTEKRDEHILINPMEFGDVSPSEFYSSYIRANLNPRFMLSYVDFSIFGNYRNYMSSYINKDKYSDTFTPISNDSYYGLSKEIKEDSLQYYKTLIAKNVFNRAMTTRVHLKKTEKEIELLHQISAILKKQQTSYKIVISPLFNQIPMETEQLELLYSIFGKDRVFNFSGTNTLTTPISNYFENSHYKPFVANIILDSIY